MDEYPADISTFRTRENIPGMVYDEDKLTTIYNEDLVQIESQVQAIESVLGTFLSNIYPVGTIYINADTTDNPATYMGFGTWERFAEGRAIVGYNSAGGTFGTLGSTTGAETHTLTTGEMPSHSHNVANQNQTTFLAQNGSFYALITAQAATASGSTGGGGAHNNIQPSKVVAVWKRTA